MASLVEEEESYASEPDPVSISPPLLPQLTPADAAKLKKVKAHWREDVVGNDGVNRGLLDLPPEKVKALTPAQRRCTMTPLYACSTARRCCRVVVIPSVINQLCFACVPIVRFVNVL